MGSGNYSVALDGLCADLDLFGANFDAGHPVFDAIFRFSVFMNKEDQQFVENVIGYYTEQKESAALEAWRDIPDFVGKYQVSNIGRVKSLARRDEMGRCVQSRPIKFRKHTGGYLRVALRAGGATHEFYIHRLVMAAFIGEPPLHVEVNHKNGIKSDNRLENLEYCSHQANAQHSVNVLKHGVGHTHPMHGERHYKAKLNDDAVRIIRGEPDDTDTVKKLAARFGVTTAAIRFVKRGLTWKHVR